jgi:Family of unknown function (DUF5995)
MARADRRMNCGVCTVECELYFGHCEDGLMERSMSVAAADQPLYQIVSGIAPATIDDVVRMMESIDQHPPMGGWKDPDWLLRLDVVFAGLYFTAAADFLSGNAMVPSSWNAMLSSRFAAGIDRIQFALAGMNAHINHDLALALLATDQQMILVPDNASPQHADYEAVNGLLNTVMPSALQMLATGVLGELAQDTERGRWRLRRRIK